VKSFVTALVIVGSASALVSCESGTGPAPTIILSQQQAALLVSRISVAAPRHADIAWLADSVNLVIAAGVEVDLIDIKTDLAAGPFYAVGLQRAINASPTSFSTFHLIAFDDPSNPTDFTIVGGYRQTTSFGAPPPESVSGAFSSPNPVLSVSGHLFHVDGNSVSEWRAATGTATLQNGTPGGTCVNFQATTGVTCEQSTLLASFNIDVAQHDRPLLPPGDNTTRTATLATLSAVAGIRLEFQ
jgi:hypothetical protein